MRRIPTWLALPALGGLLLTSACEPGAYSTTSVTVGARFGAPIDLYYYSPDYYGDWRMGYRDWSPVVIYEYNGAYYPRNVRGARAVTVYRSSSGYFLPPRNQDWARSDKRFNNKRRPNDADYRRARPHPGH